MVTNACMLLTIETKTVCQQQTSLIIVLVMGYVYTTYVFTLTTSTFLHAINNFGTKQFVNSKAFCFGMLYIHIQRTS